MRGIQTPVPIDADIVYVPTERFQIFAAVESRAVFDLGCDQMTAFAARGQGHAFDRPVNGLGAAGGEGNLFRSFRADQMGHFFPGLVYSLTSFLAQLIDTRSIAVMALEIRQHGL